jgi:FtsZ-binding cell division protein ZapB
MEEEPKQLSISDNENEAEAEEEESEDERESIKEHSKRISSSLEGDLNIVNDDPKDNIIKELKESNQRLRIKLTEVVEQATSKIHKESDNYENLQVRVKEYKTKYNNAKREMRNAYKQIDIAK